MFRWSMAGGWRWLHCAGHHCREPFRIPSPWASRPLVYLPRAAIGISLASELLGTSTGFPFGHYTYLNGLGYKVAGLVPFTIPLSWFYLGLSSLLLARGGLLSQTGPGRYFWGRSVLAIAIGASATDLLGLCS